MSISAKLRWKRYLAELRFKHEELEIVRELVKKASTGFQSYYEDYCTKHEIDRSQLNQAHANRLRHLYHRQQDTDGDKNPQLDTNNDGALIPHTFSPNHETLNSNEAEEYPQQLGDYQMTQDEQEVHEAFTKVFRKLAMILHPDKLREDMPLEEREKRKTMFSDAKRALEEHRYFKLLELAEEFKVATPRNYAQQIRWMKKESVALAQLIQVEKDTYNYMFAECESDGARDKLIRRFMIQIFGPQIFSNNG